MSELKSNHPRLRRSGLFVLCGFAVAAAGLAAPRSVAPNDVDAIFAPWDKSGSPGVALAVLRDGKIIYEKSYGRANLEHDIPIKPETVFYVGSVSKQFAAAAIALLANRGALSLDDNVRKHVPEVPDFGSTITIRHLIHHTSGLRDYLALREIAGESPDGTFGDGYVLGLISRQKALNFPPGTEHLYSNSGYFLLSVIVKRVSGKSLRQFAAENIFQPLGMSSTLFRDDHALPIKNRADGYAPAGAGQNGFRISNPNFDVVGAGGVYMTIRDFLAWDENFYAPKVGDRTWIELLETPGKLSNGPSLTYAFGLNVTSFRGLRIVEHAGAYGGFRAHALRFPEHHFSVVCFTNLATMEPGQLSRRVAALYLGDAMSTPSAKSELPAAKTKGGNQAASSAPRTSSDQAAKDPGELVGSFFSDELQVTYHVVRAADGLALRCNDRPPVAMNREAQDLFRAGLATIAFQRNPGGDVTAFTFSSGRVIGLVFNRR